MNGKQGNSTLRKLNKEYRCTNPKSLVQLNPFEDMTYYASHYQHCADRLVKSHVGHAYDDEILMPVLTLYRQAYELQIKDLALCIGVHRRRLGGSASNYSAAAMEFRIGPGKNSFGHSLRRSFSWVTQELEQLSLSDEELPQELINAVELLHGIDPWGTKFRYPDPELSEPLNVDIRKLQSVLATGFNWLQAVYDHTDETLRAVPSDG